MMNFAYEKYNTAIIKIYSRQGCSLQSSDKDSARDPREERSYNCSNVITLSRLRSIVHSFGRSLAHSNTHKDSCT